MKCIGVKILLLFTFYSGLGQDLINDLQSLDIDKEKSTISFEFIEEETSGTIEGLDFDIKFYPKDISNSRFQGTAQVETIDTGNFLRDGHLMWKKFFNKKNYPKISFKSTEVVDFGENFKVIGLLTIKGITKEVIITFNHSSTGIRGDATIYTSDYDIYIHEEKQKNKLKIAFNFPEYKK